MTWGSKLASCMWRAIGSTCFPSLWVDHVGITLASLPLVASDSGSEWDSGTLYGRLSLLSV